MHRSRALLVTTVLVAAFVSGTGPASAQESWGARTESVSTQTVSIPRAFTTTVTRTSRSVQSPAIDVIATCRALSFDEYIADDSTVDTNIYVFGLGGDSLRAWTNACSDHVNRQAGEVWTEGRQFYHTRRVSAADPPTNFEPVAVEFKGHKTVLFQYGFKRLRTYTKWTTRKVTREYTKRIWSDTNFDRYINLCIHGSYRVYSSGGRLYCNVPWESWSYKPVRVVTKAKIRWELIYASAL